MKALVVYNAFSGKSKIIKKIDFICEQLKTKYDVVESFRSIGPKSLTDYVVKNASSYDLIVAAGGDGSINEVVNGLMQLENRPTLAYVPVGTCNDAGKTLGLKRNVKRTMKLILAENKTHLDVNRINGQYFVYGLAAGNLINISYKADQKLKKRFGRFAYYIEAVKQVGKDRSISITIDADGKIYSGDYFLFLATNSRYLASFKLHKKKRIYLDDSKLCVSLIKKKNRLMNLIDFALFLLIGDTYTHNIINFEATKLTITSNNPIRYNTDGERIPKNERIEVEVLPEQIEVIVSKRVLRRHFNKPSSN